jgi:hypothetical protein
MRYSKQFVAFGAGAAAALLAACSGSTAPGTSASDTIQAAQDVSDQTAGNAGGVVADYSTSENQSGAGDAVLPTPFTALGNMALGSTIRSGGCTTGQASGTFTFPPGNSRDTITYARTWGFFAAAGCENAFTTGATDSIYYTTTFSASLNGNSQRWHSRLHGARQHWLTGDSTGAATLISANGIHVWNGNGAYADTGSYENGSGTKQRSHVWTAADTVRNITFPHPRNGDVYPISGSFTSWVSDSVTFIGKTSGTSVYSWHILVTFSNTGGVGNQDAQLQIYNVVSGALVQTCMVDLLEEELVPGSCH